MGNVGSATTLFAASALLVVACGGKIDGDPSGSGRQSSTSAGDPAGAGGSATSCTPIPPITNDFESDIPSTWQTTPAPGAERDATFPIDGRASLRFDLAGSLVPSYVTIPIGGACHVRVAFTVRVDGRVLASDQVSLVKVQTATGNDYLSLQRGRLSVEQERRSSSAASMAFSGDLGTLTSGVDTKVVLAIDPATGITLDLTPAQAESSHQTANAVPGLGPITAVTLGNAPGFAGEAFGSYLLDDLSIE